jgi:hypothetical protein
LNTGVSHWIIWLGHPSDLAPLRLLRDEVLPGFTRGDAKPV